MFTHRSLALALSTTWLRQRLALVVFKGAAAGAEQQSKLVMAFLLHHHMGMTFSLACIIRGFCQLAMQSWSFSASVAIHQPCIQFSLLCLYSGSQYVSYGAVVTEVEIDLLTGESTVVRTDLVHDSGVSLNPEIDCGQAQV